MFSKIWRGGGGVAGVGDTEKMSKMDQFTEITVEDDVLCLKY